MTLVAIGLGSNLGDRERNLRVAVERLGELGRLVAVSSLYESEPIGGPEQGPYLNAVAVVDTDLAPRAVLDRLLAIERDLGRVRRERWGPRTCDLDLLLYGDLAADEDDLVVPHPRLGERRFVLWPLAEVWPDAVYPDGSVVADGLDAVWDQDIERVGGPDWWQPSRQGFAARGGWWVVGQSVLFLAVLAALIWDRDRLPGADGIVGAWVRLGGLVLFAIGFVLALWGVLALGRGLSPYPVPLPGAELVDRGPYRLVRHPIYGGNVLMLLGASLAVASPIGIVLSLVAYLFFHAKARFEEERLAERIPGYRAYAQRVRRRILPLIG